MQRRGREGFSGRVWECFLVGGLLLGRSMDEERGGGIPEPIGLLGGCICCVGVLELEVLVNNLH